MGVVSLFGVENGREIWDEKGLDGFCGLFPHKGEFL